LEGALGAAEAVVAANGTTATARATAATRRAFRMELRGLFIPKASACSNPDVTPRMLVIATPVSTATPRNPPSRQPEFGAL
jgi:hypothetical protein